MNQTHYLKLFAPVALLFVSFACGKATDTSNTSRDDSSTQTEVKADAPENTSSPPERTSKSSEALDDGNNANEPSETVARFKVGGMVYRLGMV